MVADLLARTAAHQRFDPPSLDYLRMLYRALDGGDHVQIFIAELDGVGAVAELFTSCGGVLTSRLTGMHRDDRVKKSGAAAAVIWHAILWVKAHGYHAFVVRGIPVNAVDMIGDGGTGRTVGLPGPEVFKVSFRGQPFRYPSALELLSSRLLRTADDLSRRTKVGGKLVATARRLMQGRGGIERRHGARAVCHGGRAGVDRQRVYCWPVYRPFTSRGPASFQPGWSAADRVR